MKTPKSRSRKQAPTLPGMQKVERPSVVWFARDGCVVRDGDRRSVVIGGRRVGSWEPGERGIRNALMVKLAEDPAIILEDLARAFEVSSETLRLQRKLLEEKGLEAVLKRGEHHHKGGRPLAPAIRRKMEHLFARGSTIPEVAEALKGAVHRSTVDKYHRRWESKQAARAVPAQQAALRLKAPATSPQERAAPNARQAPDAASAPVAESKAAAAGAEPESKLAASDGGKEAASDEPPPIRVRRSESSERVARAAPVAQPAPPENEGACETIAEFAPFSSKSVQHVGCWLLLLTIAGLGFYASLRRYERRRTQGRPLRVAVDALLSALAIGGRCVESVRRLATCSAPSLLLADSAPSATWVRRTLGEYCAGDASGPVHGERAPENEQKTEDRRAVSEELLKEVSGELLRRARERRPRGKPVVLFFDNHGLPYTGMHELRRIWRMQDKRTVPGAMEYWVHDVEGRPMLVIQTAPNASLPETLRQWVRFMRAQLGKKTRLLLVFDRAGAFPGLWKWLRDNDVQFVTYQRSSYRKFRREWFRRHGRPITLREADGQKVKAMVQEGRMNLGARRGRVRRIRLLMPDDAQINVIASSRQSAKWLCQTLFSRWRQENGLKHGVERWGINQLDGRQVEDVPAGTMVTNPLRANLDAMLRDQRKREKELRLQIQQLYPGHPDRRTLKRALDENRASQRDTLKARQKTPKKLPIEQTQHQGKLKQHKREYKLLVDTLRFVAQNAEAELAASLAGKLPRPEEAKRLLQNVFGAPGSVRVSASTITISLAPAANRPETEALNAFFSEFNQRRLCHPGDPFRRPVRFKVQMP